MATTTFSIRMDPDIKKQFDGFCAEVGMNPSTAFNLFARVVVRERRLPFEVEAPTLPRQELFQRIQDIEEGRNIVHHDLIEA
ncbi:MAG: type II toxin-antitoxin system RelB/DinJ family antitoxin [Coriobacteriales bacterium]|jgi:addiction module RelB/DinJ family antitoxin|nr:type II toxin-antitoxin system RelB/DinJ family antitoxin [Coriobacteriales bacterium]